MKKLAPNYQFDYHFFDEIFDRDYRNERMMGKIFGSFMMLSIVIACMGLIGIATFLTEQRTKEIGIRKVLGASVPSVTGLLSRDLTRCVLLANILAWPVAYLVLDKWLQNFAYRANLGMSLFILSGLAALVIALLTISYQTIKAATANPVDSLRYE
jgi:putative ABC transport system permease protein